jgi:CheY-like chemotaxis protein
VRCLIVDDNPRYVAAARELLERQGLNVVGHAANGADAIAIAAVQHPDLALVDLDLGPESGFDVARKLASLDRLMPIILISAYDESDFQDLIGDTPAVGFISKAILSLAEIERLLKTHGKNLET